MKITVDLDCTPNELRTFMGLPDLEPMQQAVLTEMQRRMISAMDHMSPTAIMKDWLTPMGAAQQALFGFVGGNGAGKTTTMRMIMGVLRDAGQVLWGDRPMTAADRQRFGYMPEERGLYPKQKVAEQLAYLGQLSGCRRRRRRARSPSTSSCSRSVTGPANGSRRSAWATSSGCRSSRPSCTAPPRSSSTSRSPGTRPGRRRRDGGHPA
jgi:ABC-type taurine transport system ATPase subunit